jgi:hypothetical protein
MYQLKQQGLIDHQVASLFISKKHESSLKFGSFDQAAIKPGESMALMKTRHKGSWSVRMHGFTTVNSYNLPLANAQTYAIFEPAFPYIYIPSADFLKWQGQVASFYKDKQIRCNNFPRGTCHFEHSCNHVRAFFDMRIQTFRLGD